MYSLMLKFYWIPPTSIKANNPCILLQYYRGQGLLGCHDRYDLSAEQIVLIYKLCWIIESFFAWWKRHLKIYYLFTRSENGEHVSIRRVRQLQNQIRNEAVQQAAELAAEQAIAMQKRRCMPILISVEAV